MTAPPGTVWRVFPRDREAVEGKPFSASYLPPGQGKGRFDLPGTPAGVHYLAETPEHAIAERIQHYRGQTIGAAELLIAGHPLALVGVVLPGSVRDAVADLCDPGVLLQFGVRPDETASRDRKTTQRIAAIIHAAGYMGLRWWSALSGDWHIIALFNERLDAPLGYAVPESLHVDHPAIRDAARTLGIAVADH